MAGTPCFSSAIAACSLLRVQQQYGADPTSFSFQQSVFHKTQDPSSLTFAPQAASAQVRNEFKANIVVDVTSAQKLFATGQRELIALRSMAENDSLKKYPGPPKEEKLHRPASKPVFGLFARQSGV